MTKKRTMSRKEALSLYQDLEKTMAKVLKNSDEYEKEKELSSLQAALRAKVAKARTQNISGQRAAVLVLVVCAAFKIGFAALDVAGLGSVQKAHATVTQPTTAPFSREEMIVLTSLDSRRAELEERAKKLEKREQELEKRDQEFAVRLAELRDLSSKLKLSRDEGAKRKSAQLDQLANVYIAMNPKDAADLLAQLDEAIALELLQRMPEKRMGQILPLMSPDRALRVTKMLSSGKN